MTTDNASALQALRMCRSNVRSARVGAADAATHLAGARAARADELAEKLADAICHCERLIFIVEGDRRSEEYS